MVTPRTVSIIQTILGAAIVLKLCHTIYKSHNNNSNNNNSTSLTPRNARHNKNNLSSTDDDNNTNLHETLLYEVGPYTKLDMSTIKHIVETYYNLGEVTNYKVLKGGLSNSNYRVDTNTSPYTVLLKVCDNKAIQQLISQIRVLVILKQYHIPIAYPIAQPKRINDDDIIDDSNNKITRQNSSGITDDPMRYIVTLPNTKPIVLYDYIHGDWVRDPTPTMLSDVGNALARLHDVPLSNFSGIDVPSFPLGISYMIPLLKQYKHDNKYKHIRNHEFVLFLEQHLNELNPIIQQHESDLPHSICHSDVFVQNIMFSGQSLLAFIDFEEVSIAPSITDVGMTITGCCYEIDDTLDYSLVYPFLKSYTQQRTLNQLEIQLLPTYLEYTLLGIATWRFQQFNFIAPDMLRQDSYLSMVRRINTIDVNKLNEVVQKVLKENNRI